MKYLRIISATLAILSPVLLLLGIALSLTPTYADTFLAALNDKYERLYSLEGEKTVIVGGSSVAFGYESDILEKYLERPVVNFGLYAALGTKLMLDLSIDAIGAGDIVLLAPELDAQTLSLYFNAESTWQASEERRDMLRHLDIDDSLAMLGGAWRYVTASGGAQLGGALPSPEGAYRRDSFDAAGDLEYPREHNVMMGYYDAKHPVTLHPDIVSEDFIAYLNAYIAECKARGATVYFVFCPVNSLALTEASDPDALLAYLKAQLDCPVLGSPEEHVFEPGYFYDTNFHLNDAGVIAHTVAVTKEILRDMRIPSIVSEKIPPAPALPMIDLIYDGEDENAQDFTYELTDMGMMITGLTERGKEKQILTVPVGADGYYVTLIGPRALEGGCATTLILPSDTHVFSFETDAFSGSGLSHLVFGILDDMAIMPPESFDGVGSDFTVHVLAGSTFNVGYFWGECGLTFRFDAQEYLPTAS